MLRYHIKVALQYLLVSLPVFVMANDNISLLSDSTPINAAVQKKEFADFLAPVVVSNNKDIARERAQLKSLHANYLKNQCLNELELAWLKSTAVKYKLYAFNYHNLSDWQELLSRVDEIPPSVALAQSAIETGWGRSYFTKVGNSYFGQWCFKEGCGNIPKVRKPTEKYEIQKYASADDSVRSYMLNLNTHKAYKQLRKHRGEMRNANKPINTYVIAHGLGQYSDIGGEYIRLVNKIIISNNFAVYDI